MSDGAVLALLVLLVLSLVTFGMLLFIDRARQVVMPPKRRPITYAKARKLRRRGR